MVGPGDILRDSVFRGESSFVRYTWYKPCVREGFDEWWKAYEV